MIVVCFLMVAAMSAIAAPPVEPAGSKSRLESESGGWRDIMPATDLKGWRRVPVPPGAALGRDQWHVDESNKVLVCDGDGGHDMLLLDEEIGGAVFHCEFRNLKLKSLD